MAGNYNWSGPPHALPAEHQWKLPTYNYQNDHLGNRAGGPAFSRVDHGSAMACCCCRMYGLDNL